MFKLLLYLLYQSKVWILFKFILPIKSKCFDFIGKIDIPEPELTAEETKELERQAKYREYHRERYRKKKAEKLLKEAENLAI